MGMVRMSSLAAFVNAFLEMGARVILSIAKAIESIQLICHLFTP